MLLVITRWCESRGECLSVDLLLAGFGLVPSLWRAGDRHVSIEE